MSSSSFITRRPGVCANEDTVSFQDRGLKLETASDAESVVAKIRECSNLCTLCLSGNTIGVEAARAIAAALKEKPSLKRALWSDIFTGRLRSEIPLALEALGDAVTSSGAVLEELDLSDNAFGPAGVSACTGLLTSDGGRSIEVLKFHNNGLSSAGGEILAKALESSRCASSERPALRVLVCGRNRLENEGATALAQTFEKLGTLEEVSLYQNGINATGITALAKSFSANPSLRYVDLNDNTFTVVGGKAMAEVLPKLSVLECINFDDCLIRDGGFEAFAVAMEDHCGRIREIHLAFNEASSSAGLRLLNVLGKKQVLEYINLNGNEFGETGVDQVSALADSLGCSDALQSMSDDEGDAEDDDEEDDDSGNVDDSQDISTSEALGADSSGIATSPDSSKASLSDDSSPSKGTKRSVTEVGDDDLSSKLASISLAPEGGDEGPSA